MAPNQKPSDTEGSGVSAAPTPHSGHRRARIKRRSFKLKQGTGWSFVLGLLLGLVAASFVSRLFVYNP